MGAESVSAMSDNRLCVTVGRRPTHGVTIWHRPRLRRLSVRWMPDSNSCGFLLFLHNPFSPFAFHGVFSISQKCLRVTVVFKELHWLPVGLRINHKLLSFSLSCSHGSAPCTRLSWFRSTLQPAVFALHRSPGYYDNTLNNNNNTNEHL